MKLEAAKDGDDAEAIKAALEEYTAAAQKLAETLYSQQNAGDAGAGASGAGPAPGPAPGAAPSGSSEDDIIDADFEVKS